MSRTPYDPEVYAGEFDLVEMVEHYQCMRHCLYALQIALARKAQGVNAYSISWTCSYLLREIISAMPGDLIFEWARLDSMSIEGMEKEKPRA